MLFRLAYHLGGEGMKQFLVGVLAVAVLAIGASASGLFLGTELVPWDGGMVYPIYTGGWEGPIDPVNFAWTFGLDNPGILDGWYMTNLSVLTGWPRTDNVRVGLGYELWGFYEGGALPMLRHSANATAQLKIGAARVYAKAHLPIPVPTDVPYLGVSLSLGAYIVLPELFPVEGG